MLIIEPNSKPIASNPNPVIQGQLLTFEFNPNEVVTGIRAFIPNGASDIRATLGLLPLKEKEMWGKCNLHLAMSRQRVLDSQVFISNQMTLLTDQRIVELQQVRPVDTLYTLLGEFARHPNLTQPLLDCFNEFAARFTPVEVCTMLVQILVDPAAEYHVVRRV